MSQISFDNKSKKSTSSAEDPNDQSIFLNQNKFTVVSNIFNYFDFFQQNLGTKFKQFHPNLIKTFEKTQISKFFETTSSKKTIQLFEKKSICQQSIKNETLSFLQTYQQFHRTKLEEKLLKSGRFKKVNSFRTELLIEEVHSSKHCQIIKLEIQLLWYKTQILILNNFEKSPLTSISQISDSGSFGTVYLLKTLKEEFGIKCLPLQTKKNDGNHCKNFLHNSQIIIDGIKEYFFVLLFSQMEIGPKAKTIGGFDMILNKDCIEFGTQICQALKKEDHQQLKKDLSESLLEMHMLQIVHRDIKPQNMMFSPTFEKHVFIDFGCSDAMKENLGQKKVTKFAGTTFYCGDQMLALFSAKAGEVDLYFNDIISLGKSFISPYFETLGKQNISEIKLSAFQIRKIKFELYAQKYELFYKTWKDLTKQYFSQIEEIQIKLLHFFKDLRINQQLRDFYWEKIDQNIKQMPDFQQLRILMQNKSFLFNSEIANFSSKQQQYRNFLELYKRLKIQCSNFTKEESEISLILFAKQNVSVYFQEIEVKLQKNQGLFEKSGVIKLCVVVAFYATFAQNKYEASVEDKIKACRLAMKVLKQEKFIKQTSLKGFSNFFQISVIQLYQISYFYQIFWFKIWRRVPWIFRDKSALNSIVTLYLISPPILKNAISLSLYSDSRQLLKLGNIQDSLTKCYQKQSTSEKDNSFKMDTQLKIKAMCLFWQIRLIDIFFSDSVFYFKNPQIYSNKQFEFIERQISKKEEKWMQNDSQISKILTINKQLYDNLVTKKNNFNETLIFQLLKQLQCSEIIELQSQYSQVKKWKCLMQIIIDCFMMIFSKAQSSQKISSNVTNYQLAYFQQHKNNIILYKGYLFLNVGEYSERLPLIFRKIYHVFNSKQLYFRFVVCIQLKFSLRLYDWTVIREITQIVKRSLDLNTFFIENHTVFIFMMRSVMIFIEKEVKKHSTISENLIQILSQCFQFVTFGWQIASNYSLRPEMKKIPILPHEKLSIEPGLFQKIIKNDISFRSFHRILCKLGQIYKKVILNTDSQGYHRLIISQHHRELIEMIEDSQNKYSFQLKWLKMMELSPEFRRLIHQNSLLLNTFVEFFFQNLITNQELQAASSIINYLYEDLNPQDYSKTQNTLKLLPPLNIAFTYYQINLINTHFAQKHCQNIIKLYKISIQQNNLQLPFVLYKSGFIRTLFNAFIYTQKSYQEIFQYLQYLSLCIGKFPQNQKIRVFVEQLLNFLWCQCRDCFYRKQQNWNPDRFTQHLYQNIKLVNPRENPYMSLVFYYSMIHKNVGIGVKQKFLIYISKSMQFMMPLARHYILNRIYIIIHEGFHSKQQGQTYSLNLNLKKDLKLKIPQSQRNTPIHRKFFHYYFMQIKYEQSSDSSLQRLIERAFFKELYFYDYKYPKKIREMYEKKLRRFYEVKQSYKKSKLIKEILHINSPWYFRQKNNNIQVINSRKD